MRSTALILLLLLAAANAVPSLDAATKESDTADSLSTIDDGSYLIAHDPPTVSVGVDPTTGTPSRLIKRKGGGRGGGGGGGRSGGGGGGGSSGGRGPGGSLSNAGGRTTTGSGTPKSFGGYYGGGGGVPFTSGQRSPAGLLPILLGLSAVSLFYAGAWLYSGIYSYRYAQDVRFANGGANETLPVLCLCQEYSVCGCDENHEQAYVDALVANATAAGAGAVSRIVQVNGTTTLVLNGTLANGTTADGGTDVVSAAAARQGAGVMMLVVVVGLAVVLL